ncbi:MAG: hypothetical protein GTO53_11120 [Planctomycetales bacterium]|nr:hypothetical protein [Planctomycetales bacterium]NIM09667.1 hypothetical protein [Planctomycetales bacterium]NIN09150.1 hypothetical protein [Planctomycetales bacterium]NIN78257.1 hypothetical protein [Planctomycetales bacterium]NIO35448.1 hypothetical protein [Planctomycetales bacterium]
MLIPRFSIRWLFLLTACFALFSPVLAAGWRGESWAAGVAIAVLFLVVTLIVYAAAFWLAWSLYRVVTPAGGLGARAAVTRDTKEQGAGLDAGTPVEEPRER